MNITQDLYNMQYIAEGLVNTALGNRTEEYQRKLAICMTPEGDSEHCVNLVDINNKIWGAKCDLCDCPIKVRSRSDKGCIREKW